MDHVREKLIGAWRLVACTLTLPDGKHIRPYGWRPSGIILYTPDGWMCAQLEGEDFEPASEGVGAAGQPLAYSSYYGRFSLDEERGVVTHHVEGASEAIIRGDQLRRYRFEDDRLILEGEMQGVKAMLEWQRAELWQGSINGP